MGSDHPYKLYLYSLLLLLFLLAKYYFALKYHFFVCARCIGSHILPLSSPQKNCPAICRYKILVSHAPNDTLIMSSRKCLASFGLATYPTRAPRAAPRLLNRQCRWKSTTTSQAPSRVEVRRAWEWTTSRVLLLAVGTGIVAYGVAMTQKSPAGVADYSRADKFQEPKYGSVKDMEAVSI